MKKSLLLPAFVIVATQPAAHAMLRGAARAAGAAARTAGAVVRAGAAYDAVHGDRSVARAAARFACMSIGGSSVVEQASVRYSSHDQENSETIQERLKSLLGQQTRSGDRSAVKLVSVLAAREVTLLDAAFYGNNDVACLLLSYETTDVNVAGEKGMTALHYAARQGNNELVAMLLKYGANPRARCDDGKLPIDFAEDISSIEILNRAMGKGKLKKLCRSLSGVHAGGPTVREVINYPDIQGNTALHNAMAQGDEHLVLWLLSRGANPGVKNYFGQTPLDVAKNKEIAEVFTQAIAELIGQSS